jgi:uncharacterized phage protein (TIGR01671 family)
MENKDWEPPKTGGASRREYRFRAWDPINKRMYKAPCIIFEPNGTFEAYDDAREWEDGICRNSILMQWTGLQDKNGRDIYEGDIIRSNEHSPDRFTVEFIEGGFCATHPGLAGYPTDLNHFYPSVGCLIEVVGNIYEAETARSAPNPSAGEGTTDVTPSTVQGVEAQAPGGLAP